MHGLSSGRNQRSKRNWTGIKRRDRPAGRHVSRLQLFLSKQKFGLGVERADTGSISPCAGRIGAWHKDDLFRIEEEPGCCRRHRLFEAVRCGRQAEAVNVQVNHYDAHFKLNLSEADKNDLVEY